MATFFHSGRVVDLILLILTVEVLVLAVVRRRRTGRAQLPILIGAALPGVFLLLALRAALVGAGWEWIALWLAVSFPAHIADMRRRLS